MPDEADVKALAESYKGRLITIEYHNDNGIISAVGVLTEESREALARVTLERVEERWETLKKILRVTQESLHAERNEHLRTIRILAGREEKEQP